MSQHDYVFANQTGASLRADLNLQSLAVVSQNSGATEPTTKYAYMLWADTTTGIFKQRNAANSAWIPLFTMATGISATAYAGTHTYGAATALSNIDSVNAAVAFYTRVGDVVSVSGRVSINTTATGAYSFELNLPIASNISAEPQLAGNGTTDSPEVESCRISGEATNDTAVFSGIAASTGNRLFSYNFSYRVI